MAQVSARTVLTAVGLASGLAIAPSAQAAGGHHSVDDAAVLDEGLCKIDGWFSRASGGPRLLHTGTGCRVGPVELGLSVDYGREDGRSETGYGVQAKYATELADGLSAGVSLDAGWLSRARPRYQATTLVGLLTWVPRQDLTLHFNLGRDFARGRADGNRGGVALEWTMRPGWTLLGERYREEGTHFVRAGLRSAINDRLSADLSHALRISGPSPSYWTLGLNWQFERP